MLMLIQAAKGAQGFVDFLIAWQVLGVAGAQLLGGLALGKRVVGDAIFRHQARSLMRQLLTHQVALGRMVTAHQNSWSLTASAGLAAGSATIVCSGGRFSL